MTQYQLKAEPPVQPASDSIFSGWARAFTELPIKQALTAAVIATAIAVAPVVPPGIFLDSAANSGTKVASSSYTFSRTVNVNAGYLVVDIGALSSVFNVVSVVDDSTGGAVPMKFLGAVTGGTYRQETWGLVAPAVGTKTIAVTLSNTTTSGASAVSYGGVNQSEPIEGFTSLTGTNSGIANPAIIGVTTESVDCWVHSACATGTNSIVNFTIRNNISVREIVQDTNGNVTQGSTTNMSFSQGATASWSATGFALRPVYDQVVVPYFSPSFADVIPGRAPLQMVSYSP